MTARSAPVGESARTLFALGTAEGQRDQGLLLDFVGLGGSRGRRWTRGSLHRKHRTIMCDAPQAWQHVEQRSHVGGLFLDPDNVAGGSVTVQFRQQLRVRKWIKLIDENDCGVLILAFLALHVKLMSDLSGAQ